MVCTGLGGRARYLVRFQGAFQGTTYAHRVPPWKPGPRSGFIAVGSRVR